MVDAWDLNTAKHTVLVEYTLAIVEPFASYCTAVAAMVEIASAAVVQNSSMVEVAVIPPTIVAMVDALFNGLLPSHSTCPFFCPGVYHMRDNPYLHAQQIDKMCRLNLSASWPSSAYNHNLHVDSHKLGRYTPWHTAIT